jgi:hypothetical protein
MQGRVSNPPVARLRKRFTTETQRSQRKNETADERRWTQI